MFAFILLVTITLPTADAGPPRMLVFPSIEQSDQASCEKRAQAAADAMGESMSASMPGAKIEIRRSCVRLETRNI